jgi:hypothetical protein
VAFPRANRQPIAIVVLAWLAAGAFLIYGSRRGLSPWVTPAGSAAIINSSMLAVAFSPLCRNEPEVRRYLVALVVEIYFFDGAAFAQGYGHKEIAWLGVLAGIALHVLVKRPLGKRMRASRTA